jgi:proteasome lid subunit RPN8/RPN11
MKQDKRAETGDVVKVNETTAANKPVRRRFPGPQHADATLRVAMERSAYAELIAHAKSSLRAEVCGILAGEVCEDDEGLFVSVEAIIQGAAATEASTHVTFTQQTWNSIHAALERDYPKLRIVGWYHTHPGFGVEFSDMDLFIQRNFFPEPTHLALVMDPLSGAVAVCINRPDGIRNVERFWVDGREQSCVALPASGNPAPASQAASGGGVDSERLRALDQRVGQLVQALDELRRFHLRLAMTCGFVVCLAAIGAAAYLVYRQISSQYTPPRVNSMIPVPIKVGDKTVMMGVGVVEWDVPPELNAVMVEAELQERRAAAEAAAKNGDTNQTNSSTPEKKPN